MDGGESVQGSLSVAFEKGDFRWECTGVSGLTPEGEFVREHTGLRCLVLGNDFAWKRTGLSGLASECGNCAEAGRFVRLGFRKESMRKCASSSGLTLE